MTLPGLTAPAGPGAGSSGVLGSAVAPGSVVALPAFPVGDSPGVGFATASGEPGSILAASGRLAVVGEGFEGHGLTVQATAGALVGVWRGQAASAYQEVSGVVSARFRAAAGTSRAAAAALRGYAGELERCQREGMTATREAERCLGEIRTQSERSRAAQSAEDVAEGALSAARARGSAARAAGPLGVALAAVADAEALVAQAALSGAQADRQAAARAVRGARDELAVWQARGRRAWQDAQWAADQASGSLQALRIVPPTVAGVVAVSPLVGSAPFASAGKEECGASPGQPDEPTIHGGLITDGIPETSPWSEEFTGRDPSPGDGLHTDPIPENPPWRDGATGREPTPGENTITDPAPEPCGRQQVNDKNEDPPAGGAERGANGDVATPEVENVKLHNIVNDLYKGTANPDRVGSGTTADAVRNESATGEPTGGTFHTEKAKQYSTGLTKVLQGDLNYHDRLVAESLLDDLQNALGKNR